MHRTRVGYAGGSYPNPTYRDLDDHSEAIEITYDPATVSYGELLGCFRAWHNPLRPKRTQYRSAILAGTEAEAVQAREAVARWSDEVGEPLTTSVERFDRFHKAEDYHQKYRLRRHPEVVEWLAREHGEGWDETPLATRLNAKVGGEDVDVSDVPERVRRFLR